ncbi:MAG: ABC transporter ATP-binding protein [bacterium]|nr:ABC transporter ATP-binding protein [bacterium]
MSQYAIQVRGLGKQYRLGERRAGRYQSVRDTLVNSVKGLVRRGEKSTRETFWALRDVNFDVPYGEVLGVIGRNGAGKSTLLKILTRITEPTQGEARIRGRVGSLLEVGTGFHPELTGRENVYLNGAILGMTRREIARKFDEIVDFAEIEQFIDTPAKHYSSGMYMRLAFAVAAHLEPEILLVDEVLAVGDAAFQKKSLGKMGDVARSGRTVLFVSHNMAAVQQLCTRGLLLRRGKTQEIGDVNKIIEKYLHEGISNQINYADLRNHPGRRPGSRPLLTDVWIRNPGTENDQNFNPDQAVEIVVRVNSDQTIVRPTVGITIENGNGQRILTVGSHFSGQELPSFKGVVDVRCVLPQLPLLPGTYFVNVGVGPSQENLLDAIYEGMAFEILPRGDSMDSMMTGTIHGAWRTQAVWELQKAD